MGQIYRHLGAVIRRRRKFLGLRQEDLAKILKISRGALSNIETGRQGVLVHQLYHFSEFLGVQPSDFLLPAPPESNALEAKWMDAIPANLKPRQREQIARLLVGNSKAVDQKKEG